MGRSGMRPQGKENIIDSSKAHPLIECFQTKMWNCFNLSFRSIIYSYIMDNVFCCRTNYHISNQSRKLVYIVFFISSRCFSLLSVLFSCSALKLFLQMFHLVLFLHFHVILPLVTYIDQFMINRNQLGSILISHLVFHLFY